MPAGETLFVIAAYAIAINLAGFLAFAWDKHRARNGMWRLPERTLLALAAIGGTLGAIIGQRVLRHKTWKEPFQTHLVAIAMIQAVVVLAMFVPQVRNAFWTSLPQMSSQQMSPQQAASPQKPSLRKPDPGPPPRIIRH